MTSRDKGVGNGFSSAIRKLIVEPAATALPAAGLRLPISASALPHGYGASGRPGRGHDGTGTAGLAGAAGAAKAVQAGTARTGAASSAANATRRTHRLKGLLPYSVHRPRRYSVRRPRRPGGCA